MIGAFIVILVGVVLINSIADSVSELDDIIPLLNNQSFAWAGNNTLVKYNDADAIPSTVQAYHNGTKMGLNTNYSTDQYGIYILNQTAAASVGVFDSADIQGEGTPIYNMTYTHEGDNYLNDSTSRTLMNLIIIFFALAILSVGYVIVMKAYDDMNF